MSSWHKIRTKPRNADYSNWSKSWTHMTSQQITEILVLQTCIIGVWTGLKNSSHSASSLSIIWSEDWEIGTPSTLFSCWSQNSLLCSAFCLYCWIYALCLYFSCYCPIALTSCMLNSLAGDEWTQDKWQEHVCFLSVSLFVIIVNSNS